MPYSTSGQVRAICDTDITDAEITELIEESDWLIDQKISSGGVSTTGYRRISRMMTAYMCMLKDPNASGLGEWTEDRAVTLKLLKDEIDASFKAATGGAGFTVTIASIV